MLTFVRQLYIKTMSTEAIMAVGVGATVPFNKVSMQGFEVLTYLFYGVLVFALFVGALFLYGLYVRFKGK